MCCCMESVILKNLNYKTPYTLFGFCISNFIDDIDQWPTITVTSWWARWRPKSPASGLYARPFVQVQIKENIKAPRHWLCEGNPPVIGEFPAQRASNAENVSIWWRHHCYVDCRPLPGMFTSRDHLSEFRIDLVAMGLLSFKFVFSTRIICRVVQF